MLSTNLKQMDLLIFQLDVGYGVDSEKCLISVNAVYSDDRDIKRIKRKARELGLSMRKKGDYYFITEKK